MGSTRMRQAFLDVENVEVLAIDHSNQVHQPLQIEYDLLALDHDNEDVKAWAIEHRPRYFLIIISCTPSEHRSMGKIPTAS